MNEFSILIITLSAVFCYSVLGIIVADAGWIITKDFATNTTWVKMLARFAKRSIVGFRWTVFLLWPLIIIVGLVWVFIIDGSIFTVRFLSGKAG